MARAIQLSFIMAFSVFFLGQTILESSDAFAQRRKSPSQIRESKRKTRKVTRVKYISMHRMAGCGLGAQVFDSDEKFSQAGASLLNFTGLQSIMISFGISGCTYDGITEEARETRSFVESNIADIRLDMSIGSGEYLSALSSLYGCNEASKARFSTRIKQAYKAKEQRAMGPGEMIEMINAVVSNDVELQQSCGAPQLAMLE